MGIQKGSKIFLLESGKEQGVGSINEQYSYQGEKMSEGQDMKMSTYPTNYEKLLSSRYMKNGMFLLAEKYEKYVGKGVPTRYSIYISSRNV